MESLLGCCTARSTFFEEFGTQVLGEVIIHTIIPIFHPWLCFILGFYCVPPGFMRSVIHMGGGGGGGGKFSGMVLVEKNNIFYSSIGTDFSQLSGMHFNCIPEECWDAALVHFLGNWESNFQYIFL